MARERLCPRDQGPLREQTAKGQEGDFRLDICPTCHGAWFDQGEVTKASGDQDIERLIVMGAKTPTGLTCPNCAAKMSSRGVGTVRVDACTKCRGVWFDAGELKEAARTLGGGLADASLTLAGLDGFERTTHMARSAFVPSPNWKSLLTPPEERTDSKDVR